MEKPNFFIVGAPKCGTTALSEYLRSHPNIFVSWPKEPHYFAEDFPHYRRIKTLNDYMALFRASNDKHIAVGEASIWYLYSSVAIKNIQEFDNQAKIIVMLRNPIDLVQSLHAQQVVNFFENERDFEAAWRLQSSRKSGKNIPSTCPEASHLLYAQVGRLGEQLERVLTVFPKEQVKVILFDDFVRSTPKVYEEVLAFLNVPSDSRYEFPKINTNKEHRVAWIGKLMYHPPFPLRLLEKVVKKVLNTLGFRQIKLWHWLLNMTTKKVKRKPLSPSLRAELINEFKDDIKKISKILGRDLSAWTELDEHNRS